MNFVRRVNLARSRETHSEPEAPLAKPLKTADSLKRTERPSVNTTREKFVLCRQIERDDRQGGQHHQLQSIAATVPFRGAQLRPRLVES